MNIKFTSWFLSYSGYGRAARSLLQAMLEAGINVTTEVALIRAEMDNLDEGAKQAKKLANKKLNYDIKIIMFTPEYAIFAREKNKYNIGMLFWEVLGVDKYWVDCMNKMSEIWTSSHVSANTFKDSGVIVPIKVIKQPIEIKNEYKPIKIKGFKGFLFYSIFEWTERKNPKMLLKTYWKTFANKNDVALLLKVYQSNFLKDGTKTIKDNIYKWKEELNLKHYPKIFLFLEELSTYDIMRLHKTGNCFVAPHRGEGWGYPQMEAMSVATPIISTNFGGIHKFLNNKNSWLLEYKLINVFGMEHIQWYNSSQLWAEPNDSNLAISMWEAYSNRKLTIQKGKLAQDFVKNKLNMKVVGDDILKKLEAIK